MSPRRLPHSGTIEKAIRSKEGPAPSTRMPGERSLLRYQDGGEARVIPGHIKIKGKRIPQFTVNIHNPDGTIRKTITGLPSLGDARDEAQKEAHMPDHYDDNESSAPRIGASATPAEGLGGALGPDDDTCGGHYDEDRGEYREDSGLAKIIAERRRKRQEEGGLASVSDADRRQIQAETGYGNPLQSTADKFGLTVEEVREIVGEQQMATDAEMGYGDTVPPKDDDGGDIETTRYPLWQTGKDSVPPMDEGYEYRGEDSVDTSELDAEWEEMSDEARARYPYDEAKRKYIEGQSVEEIFEVQRHSPIAAMREARSDARRNYMPDAEEQVELRVWAESRGIGGTKEGLDCLIDEGWGYLKEAKELEDAGMSEPSETSDRSMTDALREAMGKAKSSPPMMPSRPRGRRSNRDSGGGDEGTAGTGTVDVVYR